MSRTRPRPHHRHLTRSIGCALALGLALCAPFAPASAQAASPLTWSSTAIPGHGTPTAVSCASESLCVSVNNEGSALVSDPTSSNPSWGSVLNDAGQSLDAVSCAPAGPCVAVDGAGSAFASASGWARAPISGGGVLTGVSCPSASLCVAVNKTGDIFTSTSSGTGGWALASSHPGDDLRGVSCATQPTQTLCVAVGSAGVAGVALSTTTPSGSWTEHKIDSEEELVAVSCWATGTCVAVDHGGHALASADPGSSAPTWSATPIDSERLTAVSCATTGLCVAVDAGGQALASDGPTAAIPLWSPSSADSSALAGVSCLPGGFCMAVNSVGNAVAGRVSAPQAKTVKPTEVTTATATLAGEVNPNDAVLGACAFEYGTSVAYIQSVPCALLPTAIAGAQSVSALIAGLEPNTTYHYRVLAATPAGGTTVGAYEAFTTGVSSLVPIVHPNPSISGTPANGQHLTCHPGTPSGSTAQLTYAWLRDLIPIAGATGSTYTVKGQDTGHHLQCEVTATDGGGSATAKSAFVTIPVGGAPVSAGETAIGKAAFKSGKLIVPILCSSQASGGCSVALRLTAVETLSGGRVVAVAARSTHNARKSAAALRHRTVTLASVRLRVARGAHFTVTAALDTTGRRLLSSERHFGASLSVTGTVIGVIEAQLTQQLLTLSTGSHSASTHAARRR
jgi:hypothetical protein